MFDLTQGLEHYLTRRLNAESPNWHVEVVAEPIVHAVMEFRIKYQDVVTASDRRRQSGLLTRTVCRHGLKRPIAVQVKADGDVFVVQVAERVYRKRGAATAIADLFAAYRAEAR